MPHVFPSDVVKAIEDIFPGSGTPNTFPDIGSTELPSLAALVQLVESVPQELLILEPSRYAELIASVSYLRAIPDVFQARQAPLKVRLHLKGFNKNPIALIREAMAACQDEAPAPETVTLAFVAEEGLRESIRLDISAANRDVSQGG